MKRLVLVVIVIGVAICGIVTVTSVNKSLNRVKSVKNNTNAIVEKPTVREDENELEKDEKDIVDSKKEIFLDEEYKNSKGNENLESTHLDNDSNSYSVKTPVEKPNESSEEKIRESVIESVAYQVENFKKAISDGENMRVIYGSMGFVNSVSNSLYENYLMDGAPLNNQESKYIFDTLQATWNEYTEQNLD